MYTATRSLCSCSCARSGGNSLRLQAHPFFTEYPCHSGMNFFTLLPAAIAHSLQREVLP